jgi:hypothetical protein
VVLNATFNNISAISWMSVLLVRKPEYPEKTTDLSPVTYKLYHKDIVSSVLAYIFFKVQIISGQLGGTAYGQWNTDS